MQSFLTSPSLILCANYSRISQLYSFFQFSHLAGKKLYRYARCFNIYVFLSVGFSVIINKLKELVLVLVNCFQDFIPLLNSMPQLDAQSFECILSILQSIDIALRFFIYVTCEERPESKPLQGTLDQTLSSSLSKKLLGVFPLNSNHHLSVKVFPNHHFGSLMTFLVFCFLRISS